MRHESGRGRIHCTVGRIVTFDRQEKDGGGGGVWPMSGTGENHDAQLFFTNKIQEGFIAEYLID